MSSSPPEPSDPLPCSSSSQDGTIARSRCNCSFLDTGLCLAAAFLFKLRFACLLGCFLRGAAGAGGAAATSVPIRSRHSSRRGANRRHVMWAADVSVRDLGGPSQGLRWPLLRAPDRKKRPHEVLVHRKAHWRGGVWARCAAGERLQGKSRGQRKPTSETWKGNEVKHSTRDKI